MSEHTDFTAGVAVITGAGSGIGAGLVEYAAGLGMRIALADIDADAIELQSRLLAERGVESFAQRTDVRDFNQFEALAARVYEQWGTATLLVNNAGIELHGNTWELPVDAWQRVIDVNLNGVFYGLRAFVPRMLTQRSVAHVVNISSVAALRINPSTSAYAATKHGTLALTECMAGELASVTDLVRVSAVLPGAVRSKIFENAQTADADGVGAASRRKQMESLERNGIDPLEAARIIFEGAGRGQLRIHTDPDTSRRFIEQRFESLSSL